MPHFPHVDVDRYVNNVAARTAHAFWGWETLSSRRQHIAPKAGRTGWPVQDALRVVGVLRNDVSAFRGFTPAAVQTKAATLSQ